MLTILLVDTELELIPTDMLEDYSIRVHAKKRKKAAQKIILDSNYMHSAIERYYPGESNRRGRPDILYHFLMVVMDSILNKKGEMRVFVHTRGDKIIEVSPEVRLPKSYNRFVGVMEDLFEKGTIKTGETTLLRLIDGNLSRLMEISGGRNARILAPKGKREKISSVLQKGELNQTVIIGGFSEGDFRSDVYALGEALSIYDEELTIWSVAMEVIAQYERDFGIV